MTANTGTHECPGGCGKRVGNELVACAADWRRLPQPYRTSIWRGLRRRDGAAHAAALGLAYQWYERNPLPKPEPTPEVDKPEEPRLF